MLSDEPMCNVCWRVLQMLRTCQPCSRWRPSERRCTPHSRNTVKHTTPRNQAASPSSSCASPHCAPSASSAWSTSSSSSWSGTRQLTLSSWRCWRTPAPSPRNRHGNLPNISMLLPGLQVSYQDIDWDAMLTGWAYCVHLEFRLLWHYDEAQLPLVTDEHFSLKCTVYKIRLLW